MTGFQYSPSEALLAIGVFVLVLTALLLVKTLLSRQLRKLASVNRLAIFSYPEQIVNATRLPFLLGIALLAAVSQLEMPPRYDKLLHYAWVIVLMLQVALWGNRMITVAGERAFQRHRSVDPSGATHLMVAGLLARIVLWSLALLLTLDNLGFNITTLVASLGIGGIAVALAVQNILGDLFSSVSIALDKPFVIGDFIIIDDYLGTVEYVGLKTTRLRSLGGEQIIISNTELLKNRIRNYKRMQERRVQFNFGVSYETSVEHVERIPGMVREAIAAHEPDTRFDRAHFKACGESALEFEVVYYVLSSDYNVYMDIQQAINLQLLKHFRANGIAFAHPIRMLQVSPATNRTDPAAEAALVRAARGEARSDASNVAVQ